MIVGGSEPCTEKPTVGVGHYLMNFFANFKDMTNPPQCQISNKLQNGRIDVKLTATVSDAKKVSVEGSSYHVYIINISASSGRSWMIERRFSEFSKLAEDVKKVNKPVCSCLPSKLSSFFKGGEAKIVQQRRVALAEFVSCVVSDPRLMELPSVRAFLEIDSRLEAISAATNGDCDEGEIPLGMLEKKKATPADFRFIKMVGKGSFAKVLQAEHLREGRLYAVKVIDKQEVNQRREVRHVMAERSILQRNKQHPFLVRLHYAFQTRDKLYFVLDFINGGELFHHLQRDRRFSLERARFYAAEIASALGFLHSQNIIYRDLKPENILLDTDGHIVLTDFGLCREGEIAATFCGTPEYLAPEVLKKERYTRAVDWWCLGCVLFEMMCGLPPFYSRDHQKMYNAILHDRLTFPAAASLPVTAKNCLTALLEKDPLKRMGSSKDITEIQSHPFFASIKWDLIVQKQIKPPFKPNVNSAADLGEIDREFTSQQIPASVTVEHDMPDLSSSLVQPFVGFTYNPQNEMMEAISEEVLA